MVAKKSVSTNAPTSDVDNYLANVSGAARATLEKLRKTIKSAAPRAVEVISYQMPMYKHAGMLVGFAAFKNHCSIFIGPGVIQAHKDELKSYDTSRGTIRFPVDKPLPAGLVKKLVKARIAQNEARVARREAARSKKRKGS